MPRPLILTPHPFDGSAKMHNVLSPEKELVATPMTALCLIHRHGVMVQKEKPFLSTGILVSLLTDCAQLLAPTAQGPILLTTHSPGWHHQRLATVLASAFQAASSKILPISSGPLSCTDLHSRQLHLGGFCSLWWHWGHIAIR